MHHSLRCLSDSDALIAAQAVSLTAEIARGWLVRLASGEMSEQQILQFKGLLAMDRANSVAFTRERRLWRQLGEP